ncbi:HAD-IA family hydrolase [Herbaspirillum sp. RTI4]|uniref:HAD-IA family hydrolase n=1 Tax=Herbaspirillum sp. RTI4 TaxID=3048640 RepID=UPI002AB56E03|nr:HAD-IA family hydrolase [Herbaspirillum sp. RTI4]MDY7576932.1 HAD-IA family hydrolase [Herbaspirillum sp. RTI4]MEA9983197.1 HAD-IA family hydrolase [Herbaspirillum sp. RTI4]
MRNTTPLWLFDLDNTLHDASHAIFPAINANMNTFIEGVLERSGALCDAEAVNTMRQRYWRQYGATLLGMMRHHQVSATDFLRDTHRFDDLPAMVRAERGLIHLLKCLPGKKILLTNAPWRYSRDVLRHLGLHRHFARHVSIEGMHVHRQLRPKPSSLMLRRLLARERALPQRCILVEDTLANLRGARQLGVRTAWVTQYLSAAQEGRRTGRPACVDVKVRSVRHLLRYARQLP